MIKTKLHPQRSQESERLRGIKLTCMDNLLNTTEERVYFKDLNSRFLLVSAGWLAAVAPGHSCGRGNREDGLRLLQRGTRRCCLCRTSKQIIRTGEPMVGKLERETFHDRSRCLGLDHQDAASR